MKYFAFAALAVSCIIAAYTACTYNVGDPQIDIQCIEVDFPGLQTKYCKDAGAATQPSGSKDAGTVSREQ